MGFSFSDLSHYHGKTAQELKTKGFKKGRLISFQYNDQGWIKEVKLENKELLNQTTSLGLEGYVDPEELKPFVDEAVRIKAQKMQATLKETQEVHEGSQYQYGLRGVGVTKI